MKLFGYKGYNRRMSIAKFSGSIADDKGSMFDVCPYKYDAYD